MHITDFIEAFNLVLPLDLAMPDDPVGLQIMVENIELTDVAVAYEVDERMVRRADEAGAGIIVVFHPLIYPALKRITSDTRAERTVIELIDRRIALYSVHTAFDAHPDGTSALLARKLGLDDVRPLVPDARLEGAGMGAIGSLAEAIEVADLAHLLRRTCDAQGVRVSLPPDGSTTRPIQKVAILGGSGMSFYDDAVRAGADAFITADIRYHGFHTANDSIPVLDPGHAESEAFVTDGLAALVERALEGTSEAIRVVPLRDSTNPVRLIV
jgi:dinuclear metal center YbgI/SA1388 family protein